jgi:cbb3-type cytochrome oxidase subunit 1
MSVRCFKYALLWWLLGMTLGFVVAATHNRGLVAAHAHALLAGWASLALCGFGYSLLPRAATSALAPLHFWLHNAGLVLITAGLVLIGLGSYPTGRSLGLTGASILALAAIAFTLNIWRAAAAQRRAGAAA